MAQNNETDNLPEVDFQNSQTYLQYQKKQTKSSTPLFVGIAIFLLLLFIFLYPAFKNKQTPIVVQKPIGQSQTIQPNHLTSQKTQPSSNKNQDQISNKKSSPIEDLQEQLPFKFNFPTEGDDEQKYKTLLGQLKKLTSADPQMSNIVKFLGQHHLNQIQQMKSLIPNEKGTHQLINHFDQKNKFRQNEEDSDESESQQKGSIKELDQSGQGEDDSGGDQEEEEDSEDDDEIQKINQIDSQSDEQQSEDDQGQQNIVHD